MGPGRGPDPGGACGFNCLIFSVRFSEQHLYFGELLFEPGHVLTRSELRDMDAIGVNEVVVDVDGAPLRIFSNHMCDLSRYVDFDPVEEL